MTVSCATKAAIYRIAERERERERESEREGDMCDTYKRGPLSLMRTEIEKPPPLTRQISRKMSRPGRMFSSWLVQPRRVTGTATVAPRGHFSHRARTYCTYGGTASMPSDTFDGLPNHSENNEQPRFRARSSPRSRTRGPGTPDIRVLTSRKPCAITAPPVP